MVTGNPASETESYTRLTLKAMQKIPEYRNEAIHMIIPNEDRKSIEAEAFAMKAHGKRASEIAQALESQLTGAADSL